MSSGILFPQQQEVQDSLTFPDFLTLSDFEDFSNDISQVNELDCLSQEALLEDFNGLNPDSVDDFATSFEAIREKGEAEDIPPPRKDDDDDDAAISLSSALDALTNDGLLVKLTKGSHISPRTMATTSKFDCMSLKEDVHPERSTPCSSEQRLSPVTSLPSLAYGSTHGEPCTTLMPSFLPDNKQVQPKEVDRRTSIVMESLLSGSQVLEMQGLKNGTVQSCTMEANCTLTSLSNSTQSMVSSCIGHVNKGPTISPSIFHVNSPLSPSSSLSSSFESLIFKACRQEGNLNSTQKPAARAELQSLVDVSHGVIPCHHVVQETSHFSTMQRSQSSHVLGQLRSSVHLSSCPEELSVPTMELPSVEFLSPKQSMLPKRSPIRPMRRVFSTGDIQAANGMLVCYGDNNASLLNNSDELMPAMKVGHYTSEERKVRLDRYRQKRNERNFSKKIKYACRKTLADSRPRIRGRFARTLDDSGEPLTKGNGICHDDEYDEVDATTVLSSPCIVPKNHMAKSRGVNASMQNGT